ncbi:hypothetical protein CSQ79_15365 [Gloeocapsopsis sp. IPPAS B-1203]|nr:hypothetical protein [Gloeocapsopsis sp. IPPAS B-1203]PIG92468.1 hypothetical protein CSQ79_15365 [Gloeocapsopsis sp. IPPAS B-1203]
MRRELTRNRLNNTASNLYVNGLGFCAIERVTGVHHTTVTYWVKQVGQHLKDAPECSEMPQVRELMNSK